MMNFRARVLNVLGKGKASRTQPTETRAISPKDEKISFDEILCVVETSHAQVFIGDLFRRRFNVDDFPDFPRHFVAFYRVDAYTFAPVGYVHHTPWEGCTLCGGLVIDERFYRQIPAQHRKVIREAGGIAEQLQRKSFEIVKPNAKVIWGYVGDDLARRVDLRVGFEPTEDAHIMAVWLQPLTDEEKNELFEKVKALGPF
ncbi:MAG: hypothetical protein LBS40_02580 [Burkholderiales bacterium]|jgi:hypothetical protein|nr:hypothetical protein [Burkholderiales bacterium]